jgi:nucleoside-diphosphate-sugar epimerase
MKIFLTGATGVIGSRAIPLLLARHHEVTAAARSEQQRLSLEEMGAKALAVDLFDAKALRKAVAGHDAVVNLATHMPRMGLGALFPGAWRQNDRIRREGVRNLVSAAIAGGARRFVQESFAPVYPDCGERWITENTPLEPARYNRSVVDAERTVNEFSERGGAGVILRFGAFYGPDAEQLLAIIPSLRRGWAPLPSRPEAYISSISHDDAATAVVSALGADAGAYNVVDDEPLRRREYFDSLAQALRLPPPRILPVWTAALLGSTVRLLARSQRMSNRKLSAACGWRPKFPSAREGWPPIVRALGQAGEPSMAHV